MKHGKCVSYKGSAADAASTDLVKGDVFPALITRAHAADLVNLRVFTDGRDPTPAYKKGHDV
jgi:hypothetical protein